MHTKLQHTRCFALHNSVAIWNAKCSIQMGDFHRMRTGDKCRAVVARQTCVPFRCVCSQCLFALQSAPPETVAIGILLIGKRVIGDWISALLLLLLCWPSVSIDDLSVSVSSSIYISIACPNVRIVQRPRTLAVGPLGDSRWPDCVQLINSNNTPNTIALIARLVVRMPVSSLITPDHSITTN